MIVQYVIFAAISAGIGLVGWFLWDDMASWFNQGYHQIAVCTGCSRHAFVPGCPVHDPQERRLSERVEWERAYDDAVQWRDWMTCEMLLEERRRNGEESFPTASAE